MNILPSQEVINKIASVSILQRSTRGKTAGILGDTPIDGWQYSILGYGGNTTGFLIEQGRNKFALKISKNEKIHTDLEKELWIQKQKVGIVPKILKHGEGFEDDGQKFYWIIQELVEGRSWKNMKDGVSISDKQIESLGQEISDVHTLKPKGKVSFGTIKENGEGQYDTFGEYIDSFENKIDSYSELNDIEKTRIRSAIQKKRNRIGIRNSQPNLLHGDIHRGNIIFSGDKSRLIDFGGTMKWSYPEEEFAIMIIRNIALSKNGTFEKLKKSYEVASQYTLDQDLLELFLLSQGTRKLIKNWESQEKNGHQIWNNVIEPLLRKIESKE